MLGDLIQVDGVEAESKDSTLSVTSIHVRRTQEPSSTILSRGIGP
jgi:hypothetical protein